jgi:hypothetical protein
MGKNSGSGTGMYRLARPTIFNMVQEDLVDLSQDWWRSDRTGGAVTGLVAQSVM